MKNIMPFNGKPMIHYSIEAAQRSSMFSRIIVSTDHEGIVDCVKKAGCDIMEREKRLATDTARVVDVLKDVLERLSEKGEIFDYICCLYATSPMITSEDVKHSFDLMITRQADFCQGVTEFEISPFFAYDMDENGFIERRWPEIANFPPWKKPKVVVDNGSIYWAGVEAFLETGEMHGPKTVGYPMPRWKSVDIDTAMDLKLAEFYSREFGNE